MCSCGGEASRRSYVRKCVTLWHLPKWFCQRRVGLGSVDQGFPGEAEAPREFRSRSFQERFRAATNCFWPRGTGCESATPFNPKGVASYSPGFPNPGMRGLNQARDDSRINPVGVTEGEDHGAIAQPSKKEATTPTGLGSKGMAVYPGFRNPGLYAATPLGLTSLMSAV